MTNNLENKPIINKAIKTLLTFVFIFNVAAGLYMPIIAVYITQHVFGATLAVVGVSIAIYSIVKAIFQIPIAKRLDSMRTEKGDFYVLLVGILMAIIYSFGFMLVKNVWHLYVLEIFTGIADACIMAAYYAIFSHHIDKDSQGYEWSLFSVGALTISASLGALVGGFIVTQYGFSTIFILAAMLNAIAALMLVILFPYLKNFRHKKDYKKLVINN